MPLAIAPLPDRSAIWYRPATRLVRAAPIRAPLLPALEACASHGNAAKSDFGTPAAGASYRFCVLGSDIGLTFPTGRRAHRVGGDLYAERVPARPPPRPHRRQGFELTRNAGVSLHARSD